MGRQRIWDADRLVLYLPVATETLANIDGSRADEITNAVEKFLSAPDATADKRPRDYVWQIRDLGTNTRAFATWCQNQTIEAEAFIVQDIYKKSNEDPYWDDIDVYNERGCQYHQTFNELEPDEYEPWIEDSETREGFRLVRRE